MLLPTSINYDAFSDDDGDNDMIGMVMTYLPYFDPIMQYKRSYVFHVNNLLHTTNHFFQKLLTMKNMILDLISTRYLCMLLYISTRNIFILDFLTETNVITITTSTSTKIESK